MQDPLSGTHAAVGFIEDLMLTRDGEQSELEKAEAANSPLSERGERVYQLAMAGLGGNKRLAPLARQFAKDFERRDSASDPSDVTKTVSAAGMAGDFGSPSAEVHMTDTGSRRKRGQG